MKEQNPAWLDETHPNFLRWNRARDLSIARGRFVKVVVNQKVKTKNLSVLDLGSGEGGTSKVFSGNNFVVSFDLSLVRLNRQKEFVIPMDPHLNRGTEESFLNMEEDFSLDDSLEMTTTELVNGNALQLPFSNNSFNLIIIQDVIEHLTDVKYFYSEIKRVLRPNGTVYLSTPNKLSIFNFISDPHFGLPIISTLKRKSIKKYFLKYFRKNDFNRTDVAQLLSLKDLQNIFSKDFELSLHTKFSVQELFNGNKGIVWSNFHLNIIVFCKILKLDKLLIKIANNKIGIVNKYFTPTFYLILNRKN